MAGWNVRFLSWNKAMDPKPPKSKDITRFITQVDTAMVDDAGVDTLMKHQNSKGSMGKPKGGKLVTESATQIYLSDKGLAMGLHLPAKLQVMDDLAHGGQALTLCLGHDDIELALDLSPEINARVIVEFLNPVDRQD